MYHSQHKKIKLIFSATNKFQKFVFFWSVLMVFFSVWGAISSYSLIPFADQWANFYGFYLNVSDGAYQAWLNLELDHMIILSRALYWIDFKFFGGLSIFLIFLSYLLTFLSALIFAVLIKKSISQKFLSYGNYWILFFVFPWLFLYMQSQNLIWGYNIHFILINLLPLLVFSLLYLSHIGVNVNTNKSIAIVIGALSVLCAISGLLVLPIMLLYFIFLDKNKRWIIILLPLIILTWFFYLHFGTLSHESVGNFEFILSNPFEAINFFLLYLGAPFWHLIHLNMFGKIAASLFGLIFVILFCFGIYRELKKKNRSALNVSMLFFIIFIILSAIAITFGRSKNGLDQALVGRYTTQPIFAWASMLVIYAKDLASFYENKSRNFFYSLLLLIFLMTLNQTKALRLHNYIEPRDIAGLAIAMGVNDKKLIEGSVWSPSEYTLEIAKRGKDPAIGYFGIYPFSEIGKKVTFDNNYRSCNTILKSVNLVESDYQYSFFTGVFSAEDIEKIPKFIYVYNGSREVIGYALSGKVLDIEKFSKNYGFKGYFLNKKFNDEIYIMSLEPKCQNTINLKN
jgi:hypothetical protein